MTEKEFYELKNKVDLNEARSDRLDKAVERIATSSERTAEAVTKSESVNRLLAALMGLLIPALMGMGYYFVGEYSKTNADQYSQISAINNNTQQLDKRVTILERATK